MEFLDNWQPRHGSCPGIIYKYLRSTCACDMVCVCACGVCVRPIYSWRRFTPPICLSSEVQAIRGHIMSTFSSKTNAVICGSHVVESTKYYSVMFQAHNIMPYISHWFTRHHLPILPINTTTGGRKRAKNTAVNDWLSRARVYRVCSHSIYYEVSVVSRDKIDL